MRTTSEGLHIRRAGAPARGLASPAAIENTTLPGRDYDVVVVGAGFAGLTAARELGTRGMSVAILEARDRIGGRTFVAEVDGRNYEIGGTWIHWGQPHVWSELHRYGLSIAESLSGTPSTLSVLTPEGLVTDACDAWAEDLDTALKTYCDIDGMQCRDALSNPHEVPSGRWPGLDQASLADRFAEVTLTARQRALLSSFLTMNAATDPAKGGLYDQLRWWALGEYSAESLLKRLGRYKIAAGTSALALAMLEDSGADLAVGQPVVRIGAVQAGVRVQTRTMDVACKAVVVAVPMNVLRHIEFAPGLPSSREAAHRESHVCAGTKFVARVDRDVGAWVGFGPYPNPLTMVVADRVVEGKSILVGFGPDDAIDLGDLPLIEAELGKFLPGIRVEEVLSHDWTRDPYARGAWTWYAPGQASRALTALRTAAPPWFFANTDWAVGWRGFIDGAIEEGIRGAREALGYLRSSGRRREATDRTA